MTEDEVNQLTKRIEYRSNMTLQERQVQALEEISDSLLGIVERLERIADR